MELNSLSQENGSSDAENRELQSIQSRIRMVLALSLASLMPWTHNKSGSLLVLSSSNVNEELSGQITKVILVCLVNA